MTYRDELLAQFYATIAEMDRIIDDMQKATDETRAFVAKHTAPRIHPLTRPETRVVYNYCPPVEFKTMK